MKVIGSRRLPCGHHSLKLPDAVSGNTLERVCPTCDTYYIATFIVSEYMSAKLGREVCTLQWECDPDVTLVGT